MSPMSLGAKALLGFFVGIGIGLLATVGAILLAPALLPIIAAFGGLCSVVFGLVGVDIALDKSTKSKGEKTFVPGGLGYSAEVLDLKPSKEEQKEQQSSASPVTTDSRPSPDAPKLGS